MGKRKIVLLLAFLLFSWASAMAQEKTVTGKVTDESGNPIFGATIAVKGTTIGTISGENGAYTIRIPERVANDSLVFSYIGYADQVQSLAGRTTIDVALESADLQVEEVVVTALGISKSRRAVGSGTVQLSGDELNRGQNTNPMEALAGKVAGVDIASAPGPGASQNIMIRGAASFTNNQPLYVIDGVPFINTEASGDYKYGSINGAIGTHQNLDKLNNQTNLGSGINAINPNDIESMTVLKGAAATALYGSRAANGVVLITTKNGKNTDGKMTVTYDGSIAVERVGYISKSQDRWGQGWFDSEYQNAFSREENGNWGPQFTGLNQPWGNIYKNSQKVAKFEYLDSRIRDFYELGVSNSHSVSATGGTQTTSYYFSVSNTHQDGVIPDDYDTYNRTTVSTRGSHKWGIATITSSFNFSTEKTKAVPSGQGTSMIQSLWDTPNNISLVDLKDLNDPFNTVDYFFTPFAMNPYYLLENQSSELRRNKIYGKFQADLQIFKDLKFTYRFGGDVQFSNTASNQSIIKYGPESPISHISTSNERNGYLFNSRNTIYEINNDMFFTYSHALSSTWNVNAILGYSIMETKANTIFGEVTSLDIDGFYQLKNSLSDAYASQDQEKKRMLGAFANIDFDWNRMVYLTVTLRNDWSSTLPNANNSYMYPGVTASWIFTELGDGGHLGPLTFGKLRASYGFTGKDADPYSVYNVYTKSQYINPGYNGVDYAKFPLNGKQSWMAYSTLGNPDLKPEMTNEYEFGLDLEFFNGRLGFEGDYYNKYTKDLIEQLPIDVSTGFTHMNANLGDVRNEGYELVLHGTPLKLGDFSWKLSVNFSQNYNTVEKLKAQEVYLGGYAGCGIYAVEGKAMGQFKSQVAKKVKGKDGLEHIVVDGNGLVITDEKEQYIDKDVNEKFRAGLTSTFDYKGFSLSATFDLHYGGYMFSHTKSYLGWTGAGFETTFNDRNLFVVPNSVVETKSDDNAIAHTGSVEENNVVYYELNENPLYLSDVPKFYSEGGFDKDNDLIIDRSYLKLRNVTLSYTLPRSLVSKWKLQDVRFSLSAANILLWTPAENCYVDPETTTYGNNIMSKFGEYFANPTNQVYTLGVSVKF